MALPKKLPTKTYKVGSFVLGNQFNGNKWYDVPLANLPEYITPGMKSLLLELELKCTAQFSTAASDPALSSLYLHNVLDSEVYGPGGFRMSSRKGWHDPLWAVLSDGKVGGTRALDLPATGGGGAGSYARTFTKTIKFVDDRMSSRLSRCVPAIALAKSGGKLRWYLHATAEAIKGVTALGVTALTVDVYAKLLDVPASAVPLPAVVEEMSVDGIKDLNPGPGIGVYQRIAMVNGPQFGGNGGNPDDLSAYASIDSFGSPGSFAIIDQPTDLQMREFISNLVDEVEPHNPSNTIPMTGQKTEFRLLDTTENVDGKLRMIPLIYPRDGGDITQSRRWTGANPVGKFNNNSTAGLPTSVDFLIQRVVSRDSKFQNAVLDALSPRARGRQLTIPPGFVKYAQRGGDLTRIPMIVDAR